MADTFQFQICDKLKASADLLRLPWQAVATSLVFLHRFRHFAADYDLPNDVATLPSLAVPIPSCFVLYHFYHGAKNAVC